MTHTYGVIKSTFQYFTSVLFVVASCVSYSRSIRIRSSNSVEFWNRPYTSYSVQPVYKAHAQNVCLPLLINGIIIPSSNLMVT